MWKKYTEETQESCNDTINIQFVFKTKDLTKDEKGYFS